MNKLVISLMRFNECPHLRLVGPAKRFYGKRMRKGGREEGNKETEREVVQLNPD